ncbi:hypothetical protein IWQ62_002901 [Dispira parvispora]|uniref:Uncharacterized protein n=1 Tax=Dispira parvispora TaxID=1520584 RepID=A0A9W8APK8_9FUNG|nr:hypothetical protein IWQ62_002901 [Dispira parvispora]
MSSSEEVSAKLRKALSSARTTSESVLNKLRRIPTTIENSVGYYHELKDAGKALMALQKRSTCITEEQHKDPKSLFKSVGVHREDSGKAFIVLYLTTDNVVQLFARGNQDLLEDRRISLKYMAPPNRITHGVVYKVSNYKSAKEVERLIDQLENRRYRLHGEEKCPWQQRK